MGWQKDFTVVDWDQRGASRTFGRNGAEGSGPLSIERLTLFAAYVGSGQFVSAREGDALGYPLTLAAARAAANTEAVQTLEALGPPPWQDVKARNETKGWAARMTKTDDPASKMRVGEMLKALAGYSDDLNSRRRS